MKGLIPCKKLSMLFEYPQSALFSFELFGDIRDPHDPTTLYRVFRNLYVHSKEKLRKVPIRSHFSFCPRARERRKPVGSSVGGTRNKEEEEEEGGAGHPSRFRTFRQRVETFFPRDLISLCTPRRRLFLLFFSFPPLNHQFPLLGVFLIRKNIPPPSLVSQEIFLRQCNNIVVSHPSSPPNSILK